MATKLDTQFKKDVLNTILFLFNRLTTIEKKTILYKLEVPKTEIEKLEDLEEKLKEIYIDWLSDIDETSTNIESKYKNVNLFMSKENSLDFKTEIETYKNL
tara:strand:- start:1518 stop:1820 length:303 start_codon:yes stop_codon:yes gene_type:complete